MWFEALVIPAFVIIPMAASYRRAPSVALPVVEDAATLDICFRRLGWTRASVADRLHMTEAELSRQMGARGITSARLRLLGDGFLSIYAEELCRKVRDTESRLSAVEAKTESLWALMTSAFQKNIGA